MGLLQWQVDSLLSELPGKPSNSSTNSLIAMVAVVVGGMLVA